MFVGVGFLLNGNMLVVVWKDSLIVRLGPDEGAEECSIISLATPLATMPSTHGTTLGEMRCRRRSATSSSS